MTAGVTPGELGRAEIQAGIAELFGDRADLASRYAAILTSDGITRGVIGPREADRVWERHLLNSAALAAAVPANATVIDLGSGAGLPGIPLAIARPDLRMILLEPLQRRVSFLRDCLAGLAPAGLHTVEVCHARAEDGPAQIADCVVARAVAPMGTLIGLSWGMLVDDGVLLALKGASAAGEVDQVRQSMRVDAELLTLPAPGQDVRVVRVVRPAQRPSTGRAEPAGRSGRSGRRSR